LKKVTAWVIGAVVVTLLAIMVLSMLAVGLGSTGGSTAKGPIIVETESPR
jgi:hypothetical protein